MKHLFLACLVFFLFVGLSLFAREEKTQEVVASSLKSSPWFDAKTRDYHKYKPEEIPLPKKRERSYRSSPAHEGRPGEIFLGIVKFVFFVLLALPLLYLLYFVFRLTRKHWYNRAMSKQEKFRVRHGDIPQEWSEEFGLQESMSQDGLRRAIEKALHKDDRLAVIYIYLYSLLQLQKLGFWELRKNYTARDYLRCLEKCFFEMQTKLSARYVAAFVEDFEVLVRYFEFAMYRESLKLPQGLSPHISDLWKSIDGKLQGFLQEQDTPSMPQNTSKGEGIL